MSFQNNSTFLKRSNQGFDITSPNLEAVKSKIDFSNHVASNFYTTPKKLFVRNLGSKIEYSDNYTDKSGSFKGSSSSIISSVKTFSELMDKKAQFYYSMVSSFDDFLSSLKDALDE